MVLSLELSRMNFTVRTKNTSDVMEVPLESFFGFCLFNKILNWLSIGAISSQLFQSCMNVCCMYVLCMYVFE